MSPEIPAKQSKCSTFKQHSLQGRLFQNFSFPSEKIQEALKNAVECFQRVPGAASLAVF
jgi:hypothetical protein